MELVKNRVVLVVGATDEVGEAICLRLAKGGAKLAITDTEQTKVDDLLSRIKEAGSDSIGMLCDPTNADEVEKAVGDVVAYFGRVDVLVNNVDDASGQGICDLPYDDWKKAIDVNLNSVFLFSKAIVPGMQEKKYGRVINVGSLGYLGLPGQADYAASKAAIFGFTRSLALELAKDDITVNYVVKGDVSRSGLSDEQAEALAASVPAQKLGKPQDVAMTVGFFASDHSKYVTGQTLFVCGGKSLHFSMSV
ncbi:putative 3-oxoacyl-[acyl-carrier-protein] reductase [delta proteobacterium NaphS2]|nr:putative 3-oxoacyl-[acyl-carrier-protein] reductase [delta proteobacterium NaphS2]